MSSLVRVCPYKISFQWVSYTKIFLVILLMSLQCYFLMPNALVYILKLVMPILLIVFCLKKHNMKVIHNNFIVWLVTFLIISFVSLLYSISISNSIDVALSLCTNTLILIAISQSIESYIDIEFIIKVLIIGGIFYVLTIMLVQGQSLITNGINVSYTNGTLSQFTYIITPVCIYLIWELIENNKYKNVLYILAFAIVYAMGLLSGRRKAILLPLIAVFILAVLKRKKFRIKSLVILVLGCIGIGCFFHYSISNVVLYDIYGYRLDRLFTLFTGEEGRIGGSLVVRQQLIAMSWNTFLKHPVLGIGVNAFRSTNIWKYYAHNNYLELLTSVGLVGTLTYYSAYLYNLIKLFLIKDIEHIKIRNLLITLLLVSVVHDLTAVTYFRTYYTIFLALAFSYTEIYSNGKCIQIKM